MNFMKLPRFFNVLVALLLYSTAGAFAQDQKAYVTLGGFNEVPRVNTPATGAAQIELEGDSLFVSGEFSNLKSPYHSAFIHYGEKRETGNRLFRLTPELSEDHKSGSFKKQKNGFALTKALKEHLKNGRLYVNVSSRMHQTGEIRGQIPPFKEVQ